MYLFLHVVERQNESDIRSRMEGSAAYSQSQSLSVPSTDLFGDPFQTLFVKHLILTLPPLNFFLSVFSAPSALSLSL
jgi:hypothetical protein